MRQPKCYHHGVQSELAESYVDLDGIYRWMLHSCLCEQQRVEFRPVKHM